MKTVNLNDKTTYYGSYDLVNDLKSVMKPEDVVINFAYTDYGGTFFDKVMIEYFEKFHPNNIVSEHTIYFGKNAFVFGEIAAKFIEDFENYPLGFENTEQFYYDRENEQESEDFQRFIEDCDKYRNVKFTEDAHYKICDSKGGYYNITTQGVDFSEDELLTWCKENGLCEDVNED